MDKARNIIHARGAVEHAAEQGAQLVVLPEIWNCPYSSENFSKYAEDMNDASESTSTLMLSEVARRRGITIVGGSIPEWAGDRLYTTCCVFGPDGELKAKHRKLHLFDIDIPGDITYKESDTITAGDQPTVVDTDVGRIGIGICHDIRFPELAMLYQSRGAQLICYAGAFNMSTGQLLWDLMQRARAADNQLFVASCSPARDPYADYVAWGHSGLVGPYGEVIAATGHEESTVIAEVDYSLIPLGRSILPPELHRDMYQLVDVCDKNAGCIS